MLFTFSTTTSTTPTTSTTSHQSESLHALTFSADNEHFCPPSNYVPYITLLTSHNRAANKAPWRVCQIWLELELDLLLLLLLLL